MHNGLYAAVFGTPLGDGTGVVVLQDGIARGGDSIMAYRGTYQVTGDTVVGELLISKHANIPGMRSVFGRDLVNIKLTGKVSGNRIDLTGTAAEAPGIKFSAKLTKLGN